jgi:hypothetical protein
VDLPVSNMIFMSRNAHKGLPLTVKDEMECLVYLLMDMYNGYLPWQALIGDTDLETNRLILEIKEQMFEEQRFEGLPKLFKGFLKAIIQANKDEELNYDKLIDSLRQNYEPKQPKLNLDTIKELNWNEYMCDV